MHRKLEVYIYSYIKYKLEVYIHISTYTEIGDILEIMVEKSLVRFSEISIKDHQRLVKSVQ